MEIKSPYRYFSSDSATETTPRTEEWYREQHPDCNVWLSLDTKQADEIARQYRNMISIQSSSSKLSHRAKLYFFQEDDVYEPHDDKRQRSTYFELEWAPKPNNEHLKVPPIIQDLGATFSFDTNPDCTYWLTTRRMNPAYRDEVRKLTFVLQHARAAAPYLTIEFKKDGLDERTIINQIGASTTLMLFNRYRLRLDRLLASNATLEPSQFTDIKHYGISFSGAECKLYVAKPVLSFVPAEQSETVWQGCRLEAFRILKASEAAGVLAIRQWVNEIHHWGLGEYSRGFERDVKEIIRFRSGGDDESLISTDTA